MWIILIFSLSSIAITSVNYQVIRALSLSRVYISAESIYARHRAHAVEELIRYTYNQDDFHFNQFKHEIAVPMTGIDVRKQILADVFDSEVLIEHFQQAGLAERDALLIVRSLKRFRSSGFVKKSVEKWEQADSVLLELLGEGLRIHQAIENHQWDLTKREAHLLRIHRINTRIIALEDDFSDWMAEESLQLEQILVRVSVGFTLLFMALSLSAAVYFGQRFRRGVLALYRNALRITQGDLTAKVSLPQGDELGRLAEKFNQMTDALSQSQNLQQKQNQELIEAKDLALDSLNTKSEFLANMSHEIRTPMNGVLGMLELLEGTQLNDYQRECVDLSLSSASTLLTLINDILDLSKIESGKLELESVEFDLHQCIEEVSSLYSAQNKQEELEIACYIPPNVPKTIKGDPIRLRQILANLIANAIKFSDRGSIVVRADILETLSNGRIVLRFEVEDTGIGILPENQEKLFEAFVQADGSTTRRHGGTGLGLTIASQLVDLMGGEMGVDSQLGEGARFWFSVEVEAQKPYPAHPKLERLSGWLIAEDSINLRILAQYLEEWHIQYKTFSDVAVFQTAIEQYNPDLAPNFVVLGDKLNALSRAQLYARVVQLPALSKVPIIALNRIQDGPQNPEDEECYFEYLSKPLRLTMLARALLRLTKSSPTGKSGPPKVKSPSLVGQVLIVEDNIINQRVAARMVERLGLQAHIASSGEQAIQLFHQHCYDLILMDCQMPDLDGYQTTEIIRQDGKGGNIPIIAMTANAVGPVRQRCIAAGMDECLIKPVKLELLYRTLAPWLEKNSP